MHAWSQATSLVLSLAALRVALIPRLVPAEFALSPTGSPPPPPHRGAPPVYRVSAWPRLLRFPIFWIGLALLVYLAIQGFNPSWVWERNATTWWLRRVDEVEWLPTSVDSPFERFNVWRQLIIYASAWLTVCAVWVGITRRRSATILLGVIAVNGTVLAVAGFIIRLLRPWEYVLWFDGALSGATSFASFIYKNHAGAYLALVLTSLVGLAAGRHARDTQRLQKSSPAVLYLLAGAVVFFAILVTYSRGATLLAVAYFVAAFIAFLIHRYVSRVGPASSPVLAIAVVSIALLGAAFAGSQLNQGELRQRFERLLDANAKDPSVIFRQQANVASSRMLGQCWLRGVGAGGFRFLYPEFLKSFPEIHRYGRLFWEHAHNDWFEIPIELGLAGVAILGAMALWFVIVFVRLQFWRDLGAVVVVLGSCQTLIHASFDFPFQNPALLITWLVLLVMAARRLELDRN